ncbi:MAG: LacI family DNA-binding transcriptional regulator [Candidatus Eiseniibacteriota bacterium]|nr:MAG: LacI family DNA-binding transcriptional regulator [Candidatus Eisenbacteria bacterium]
MPKLSRPAGSTRSGASAGDHTIRDIARLSGFSRSTVSLVLNGDPRIAPSTRRRIWDVIERVGYQPNCMARSLARKRSMIVAVVVPRVSARIFSDYYFSESMSGINETLTANGYRMIIQMVTENFLKTGMHLRLFRERQIDGMLLVGTLDTDDYVEEVFESGNTAVLVNSWRPGYSCVVADNFEGARRVVDHLASMGHRRIGYISGLDSTTVGLRRSEGYKQGLADCGLESVEECVGYGDFSEQSGYEAARQILSSAERPTAIFAGNDMMAIGCVECAREMGISVPGQLAVVGADDIALSSYFRPKLTTLRQPMFDIGCLATELLLGKLSGTSEWPVEKVVPTELIVRESCGAECAERTARNRTEDTTDG